MYERGGEQTAEGVLCKTRDIDANVKSENWTHIRGTDKQFCDGTKNCEAGWDETDSCGTIIVTGSDGRDGVYQTEHPTFDNRNPYIQQSGGNIIFRKGGRWVLGEGNSSEEATTIYKSEKSKYPDSK